MNRDKFMVWGNRSHQISVEHDSFELAKAEAERLAKFNPGEKFYILKQIGYVEKIETVYVDLTPNSDLPF